MLTNLTKAETRNTKTKSFTYTVTCLVYNRQELYNNGPFSKQYMLTDIYIFSYLQSDSPM